MKDLPVAYQEFLAGLDEHLAATLLPIFRESVAEGENGVLIRGLGTHSEQAVVDEHVPFGEVRIANHG
ncbi:hypothetical protein E9229_000307 [Paeniglutamicibacter cryotolerans]|uniref:Uncharacterized protein n=1 Tax=Paeniglutamicibacter cryotolerans TaxID=670079 RepID=A0A839QJA4_9MICC|nr:hypothetical protein [Paeniglutamicibacter cryotolerans]